MADAGKVMDLASKLKSTQDLVKALSNFMRTDVRPLLTKSDSDLESALKKVATPAGRKGLKHILKFIDEQVGAIRDTMKV